MAKRILFALTIAALIFFWIAAMPNTAFADHCPRGQTHDDQGNCVRALEVVYPVIPGIPTPKSIATLIPDYVNYIFRFGIIIIGLIIFGLLVYGGVTYMTSAGNPTMLTEAKGRIIAGFLGGIILLGAYLIFNTINPQLVQLEIQPTDPTRPVLDPGIYVCSRQVDAGEDLAGKIQRYKTGDKVTQIDAAKKIGEIMKKYDCLIMRASGTFKSAVRRGQNTFFTMPGTRIEGADLKYDVYEYGLILHATDRRLGQCKLLTQAGGSPYTEINQNPDFNFTSYSFTLFKKIPQAEKPAPGAQGAILHSCLNYSEGGACTIGPPIPPNPLPKPEDKKPFPLAGAEMLEIPALGHLSQNVRSIQFDPAGKIFAILIEEPNKKCEVLNANDRNLLDNDIGRCGATCWFIRAETEERQTRNCTPCAKSMIVIEGQVL